MKAAWTFVRAMGAGLVALVVLYPKTTQAEAVSDEERKGEWDDDGQRFGAIVVKGDLVLSANAPGGWSLVRTYENKSDDAAEVTIEERVERTESMVGARVMPAPEAVLTRTQTLRLSANEKKTIGTYLPEKLGQEIMKGHQTEAWAHARMANGLSDNHVYFNTYYVSYLRPLAPGETKAKPPQIGDEDYVEYQPKHPARMELGPRPSAKAKKETVTLEADEAKEGI